MSLHIVEAEKGLIHPATTKELLNDSEVQKLLKSAAQETIAEYKAQTNTPTLYQIIDGKLVALNEKQLEKHHIIARMLKAATPIYEPEVRYYREETWEEKNHIGNCNNPTGD